MLQKSRCGYSKNYVSVLKDLKESNELIIMIITSK